MKQFDSAVSAAKNHTRSAAWSAFQTEHNLPLCHIKEKAFLGLSASSALHRLSDSVEIPRCRKIQRLAAYLGKLKKKKERLV